MEVTGPAGLTSRRSPGQAWHRRPSPLRGFRHPLSRARRVSRTRVGSIVSRDRHWPCRTASHSGGDCFTGGVGRTAPWRDSQARQECGVNSFLSGEKVQRRRAHEVLERGRTSLEGATGPRARLNLARGGIQPPSEAEPHPRGRPALERGGGLPVQCRVLRAKQSSARGWLSRLSGGPLGPTGPWAHECFRFVCVLFSAKVSGFSLVV
jgi:hypothetical protein